MVKRISFFHNRLAECRDNCPAGNICTAPHTPDTAFRKAWTAVSFRTDTLELARNVETGEAWALRHITGALPLGGGVRIIAGDGDMGGAIGISGAPSGAEDAECAVAGIAEIEDEIAF